ncbi:unnamed protein product [Sympodiomycopsis kandeliae]
MTMAATHYKGAERPPLPIASSSMDSSAGSSSYSSSSQTPIQRRRSSQYQPPSLRNTIDEEDDDDERGEDEFLASLDDDDLHTKALKKSKPSDKVDEESDDDDHFDPATWLNRQLDDMTSDSSSASAPLASLDESISSLLTKVSLARTDLADEMDDEMDRAARTVPRIATQISSIGRNAANVKVKLDTLLNNTSMHQVADVSRKSEQAVADINTAEDPLARLSEIYTLHSQLSSYRTLLRLASSWSTLSADVSSLLAEAVTPEIDPASALANISSASLRLKEAKDSLDVFGGSKEGEEKAALLDRLMTSFEAVLCPRLVSSISKLQQPQSSSAVASGDDLEAIKTYSVILSRLDRQNTFVATWRSTRLAPLLDNWTKSQVLEDIANQSRPASDDGIALSVFLPTFLAKLPTLLTTERVYASSLFANDVVTALDLLVDTTLQGLQPSLKDRITRAQTFHGHQGLAESLKIVRTVREKGREVERILSRSAATSVAPDQDYTDDNEAIGRQRKASDATSQNGDVGGTGHPQTSPVARRRSLSRRLSRSGNASIQRRQSFQPSNDGDAELNTALRSTKDENQARDSVAPDHRHFAFTKSLYASLSSIWESYPVSESRLFTSLWNQEKSMLSSHSSRQQNEVVGVGDENLRHILENLQRSWTIIAELSEDATARSLEITRGLGAHSLIKVIDQTASVVINTAAKEMEEACSRVWHVFVNPHSSVASGREWTAYGRIVSIVNGLKKFTQSITDLHASLVSEFKESATILAGIDQTLSSDISEKLTKMRGANGAGVAGPVPTKSEMNQLLECPMARSREGKEVRDIILAQSAIGSAAALPQSRSSTSTPSSMPFLPLLLDTSKALASLYGPVLHSLVVLPLVPILSALSKYKDLSHWSAATLPGQVANEYQLSMPSFSLGPTETMQNVGEGVLGLVRELESSLQEEAVIYGVGILARSEDQPGADAAALKKERRKSSVMGDLASGTSSSEQGDPGLSPREHRRRSSLMPMSGASSFAAPSSSHLSAADKRSSVSPQPLATSPLDLSPPISRHNTSNQNGMQANGDESPQGHNSGQNNASADVLPNYLAILLRLLTDQLLSVVLPQLPRATEITNAGWDQLEADMDYLQRIIGALAVDTAAASTPDQDTSQPTDVKASLAQWKDRVGVGAVSQSIFGYKYQFARESIPRESSENPSRTSTPLGGSRLEPSNLRQMLQSQRRGGTPRPDSPAQKGGIPGKAQNRDSNQDGGGYTVDFNAMNVGMGW